MFSPLIDIEAYTLMDGPQLTGTPERRLLLAVLERAILDLVGNDEQEVQTAKDWLFGDTEPHTPTEFSFAWVCQQLDLDPSHTADLIGKMPRRGKNRVAPWYFGREQKQGAQN